MLPDHAKEGAPCLGRNTGQGRALFLQAMGTRLTDLPGHAWLDTALLLDSYLEYSHHMAVQPHQGQPGELPESYLT